MKDFDMPVLRPIRIPTNQEGLSFLKKIAVWLTQARKFELAEDWVFSWSFERNKPEILFIPEGFIFDGASIPRILWFILNPYGILLIPGLLHDYYYRNNFFTTLKISEGSGGVVEVSIHSSKGQKFADEVFRDVAIAVNGMKILNKIVYYSLRFFGFVAWRKHRNRKND